MIQFLTKYPIGQFKIETLRNSLSSDKFQDEFMKEFELITPSLVCKFQIFSHFLLF